MQDDVNDNSTISGYVPLYNPVPIYNDPTPPSTAPICVSYKVASDNGFSKVVDSGRAYTSSDVDYTLKVGHLLRSPSTERHVDLNANSSRLKPKTSAHIRDTITNLVSVIRT